MSEENKEEQLGLKIKGKDEGEEGSTTREKKMRKDFLGEVNGRDIKHQNKERRNLIFL